MDHSQVIKYFDEYIKKYSPYQDNEVYSSLMEYISQTYTKELYENIPSQFKQLYEDNFIDISMYDTLLKNIGIPDKILTKLSVNEKIILFKNFSDFYRYRGDVYFFDKVSKLFEYTTFDIYELYIDYDEDSQDWVFKPYELIKNTTNEPLDENISYDEIYDNVPSFLINRQQLSSYKDSKEIILPLKSNIVLLDYSFTYNVSEIINLINATFLKEYKTNNVVCYFYDSEFIFTLKTFFITWYYILLKTYESSIGDIPLKWIIDYVDDKNSYSMLDIDRIFEEYSLITTSDESRQFYEKYISGVFKSYTYSNEHVADDLEISLNSEFIEYINTRITGSILTEKQEYNIILDELLNSLILHISSSDDELFIKYSEYFINSLTRITLNPKNTSSYTLLYNYKPFHTELLTTYNDLIFSKSKFDIVTPDDTKISFLYSLQMVELCNTIDYHITNFVYSKYTNLNTFDYCAVLPNVFIEHNLDIEETYIFDNIWGINDICNLIDIDIINSQIINTIYCPIIDKNTFHTIQLAEDATSLTDDVNLNNLLISPINFYNMSDYNMSNLQLTTFDDIHMDETGLNQNFSLPLYDGIIEGQFNFSTFSNKIIVFNLIKYIGIGVGGLNVGDKVKYILDDDSHYRTILSFNLTYGYIELDDVYTGSNVVGQIVKLSSFSDNFSITHVVGQIIELSSYFDNFSMTHLLPSLTIRIHLSTDNMIYLICSSEDTVIFYTTDGTTPTYLSQQYTHQFTNNQFNSIQAIAYNADDYESFSLVAEFTNLDSLPRIDAQIITSDGTLIFNDDGKSVIIEL